MDEYFCQLSWTEVDGIVMFNRFFTPDIDIERLKHIGGGRFSTEEEFYNVMRWIGILSDGVQCDLCASTGIHNGDAVIKQLLSGAKAVQMASVLYQKGFVEIENANKRLSQWMQSHGYTKLDDFVGSMSMSKAENPAAFTRVQFMKHFAGIE